MNFSWSVRGESVATMAFIDKVEEALVWLMGFTLLLIVLAVCLKPHPTTEPPRGLKEFARKNGIWLHQAMDVYEALDRSRQLELQTCDNKRAHQIYQEKMTQLFEEFKQQRAAKKAARLKRSL